MAKNATIRKFKKDDYSGDFSYGADQTKIVKKQDPKKKHRAAGDKKRGFDHLKSED